MVSEAFFSEVFNSNFEAMSKVLERVVQALREQGCLKGINEPRYRLCIEEALVNAIRHGNHCDPDREVSISATLKNGHCVIEVCDEGRGFVPREVQVPKADQMGGRGLCLIEHYTDTVEYIPEKGCLVMKFRLRTE